MQFCTSLENTQIKNTSEQKKGYCIIHKNQRKGYANNSRKYRDDPILGNDLLICRVITPSNLMLMAKEPHVQVPGRKLYIWIYTQRLKRYRINVIDIEDNIQIETKTVRSQGSWPRLTWRGKGQSFVRCEARPKGSYLTFFRPFHSILLLPFFPFYSRELLQSYTLVSHSQWVPHAYSPDYETTVL